MTISGKLHLLGIPDPVALVQRCIQRGMVRPSKTPPMTDRQIHNYICAQAARRAREEKADS